MQINDKTDEKIVKALCERDKEGLSLLAEAYGSYLTKIALNILSDSRDAAECVNDAYYKIWLAAPEQRPENLKAYIAKITRNIALNRYKERARGKRIPSELTVAISELEDHIPDTFSVEEECENELLKKAVSSFLSSLSKRDKYIFICRYYCADPVNTIAAALGIAESTVYRELAEMRKKLKTKLIKEGLWNENR